MLVKKYALYLLRWQTSGIIIAPCIMYLPYDAVTKTIIGNLLGGLIFFWIDKLIFNQNSVLKKKRHESDLKEENAK
jgi:membrane protein YqaA with SNARE-associated domain